MIGTAAAILGASLAAASTANTVMQTKASNKALKLQTTAADKSLDAQTKANQDALAFQKQMWETQQQQLAPYMRLGGQAADRLSQWTGMNGGNTGFSNPARYSGPDMVQMRAPDGTVRPVPRAMVPHYTSRGGQVVG